MFFKRWLGVLGILVLTAWGHRATADVFTVTSNADAGVGSLRDAILRANTHSGSDSIDFNIPGPPPHVIAVQSLLPAISGPVTIDGTTESDYNGHPVVEISGEAGHASTGLRVSASNCTVRGLSIYQFPTYLTLFSNGGNNTLSGCYLGQTGAGVPKSTSPTMTIGIECSSSSPGNLFGGPNPGEGNVITNCLRSIELDSANNRVQGNLIQNLPGNAQAGLQTAGMVLWNNAHGNLIGGTIPGARNVIVGSGFEGIHLAGTTNTVQGNFVGIKADGRTPLPNTTGITVFADGQTIGGTEPGAGNLVSGNQSVGIFLLAADHCKVYGNRVGTREDGLEAVPNGWGIVLQGTPGFHASYNEIGGTAAGMGNLVSGNNDHNIYSTDAGASYNSFQGNIVGPDASGTHGLPTKGAGIAFLGLCHDSLVGGTVPGAGNICSFTSQRGVYLRPLYITGNLDWPQRIKILGNSLTYNQYIGIDLKITDGGSEVKRTLNDAGDLDDGPNGLQNYPVLALKIAPSGMLRVAASLDSRPDLDYRIEFYSNSIQGHWEGEKFLGFAMLHTNASGQGNIDYEFPSADGGAFVTATATDSSGNTSEFSDPLSSHAVPQAFDVELDGENHSPEGGSTVLVNWQADASLAGTSVSLELWAGGAQVGVLGNAVAGSGTTLTQLLLPLVAQRNDYIIRVKSQFNPALFADSSPFTVNGGPLRIDSPQGGETWGPESLQNVEWRSGLFYSGPAVKMELWNQGAMIADLGFGWDAAGDGSSLVWIPGVANGSGYTIRLISAKNSQYMAESAPFTIGIKAAVGEEWWIYY